MLSSIGEDTD